MPRVSDAELTRVEREVKGHDFSNIAFYTVLDLIADLRDARALAEVYKDLCTAYRIGGSRGYRLADKALARLEKLREADHA